PASLRPRASAAPRDKSAVATDRRRQSWTRHRDFCPKSPAHIRRSSRPWRQKAPKESLFAANDPYPNPPIPIRRIKPTSTHLPSSAAVAIIRALLTKVLMKLSCTHLPQIDPTPIFEALRGSYSTELLAAAVGHFNLFAHLTDGPLSFDELRGRLGLDVRPANVLFTALRAMELIAPDKDN